MVTKIHHPNSMYVKIAMKRFGICAKKNVFNFLNEILRDSNKMTFHFKQESVIEHFPQNIIYIFQASSADKRNS